MTKKELALYVRNFTFGVEDSLVSTVGLLSGVAVAGLDKQDIFLTGMILIFVEALSMGSGSFLSEHSSEEIEQNKEVKLSKPIIGSLIMFFSYFATGFIPLAPYIIFPTSTAFPISIILSLGGLALLGIINGKISNKNVVRHAMEMLIVGGLSITAGVVIGKFIGR